MPRRVVGVARPEPLALPAGRRVVDPAGADALLAAWHALDAGEGAAIIGTVGGSPPAVVVRTPIGGERILEELEDDPLPRIC